MTPQLRFPEFTDTWQVKKLGDIASFIKDGTHGTHPDDPRGEYYLLSAKNLQHGTIEIDDSDRKISQIEYDSITKKYALKTSDILLSIVGTIGRVSQIPEKYLGNTAYQRSVAFLRFGGENSTFIAQLFNGRKFQNELRRRQVVSAQPGIYLGDIAKIQINLPSKTEQEKIAGFLTAVDERVAVGEKKLELLETYKRGAMQKIFSQKIRFKDENGEDYPEWEEKQLGSLVEIKKGTQLNGDTLTKDGNYPMLNGGMSPSGFTDSYNSDANTVTISEGGNSCGYVSYMSEKFWSGGHLYTLVDLKIDDKFVYQLLKFKQDEIMRLRVGSGLPNIQKGDLAKLRLYIPKLNEQQKIANFLTTLDEKITAEKSKLTATNQFKKALLQRMFV